MGQLIEVRSGGQNGADLAGVAAAKVCGIPTAGWMPKGWKTLDGPRPAYGEFFGMKEYTDESGYPPRTRANVRDSDATLRFASDFQSAGERCTWKAIREYKRPWLDIDTTGQPSPEMWERAADWIRANEVHRLNVAGNSRQTDQFIEIFTYKFLIHTFHLLGHYVEDDQYKLHDYCLSRF